jgi:hypothetical protein
MDGIQVVVLEHYVVCDVKIPCTLPCGVLVIGFPISYYLENIRSLKPLESDRTSGRINRCRFIFCIFALRD